MSAQAKPKKFSCHVSESGSPRPGDFVLMCINVSFGIHGGVFAASHKSMREVLNHRERSGDKDESDGGRQEHAAYHNSSEDATRSSPGASGYPQRKTAEDER